ncbi:MAG: nitroreductase/quinone reductase family protein [Oceanicoccus sp.]
MSKILYKIINPPISLLLKSPIHKIMSSNTLIVEFRGRKSGKTMATPISYHQAEDDIHCFTAKAGIWWRNLRGGDAVRLLIKGHWITVTPEVVLDSEETLKPYLDAFLRAVPRDAVHSNVRLEANGIPNTEDIESAVGGLVLLKFRQVR